MSDENETDGLLEDMMAPEEAMEEYPDECENCGSKAGPFWVPNDYHEQSPEDRDPGVCTECGCHFGTGEEGEGGVWTHCVETPDGGFDVGSIDDVSYTRSWSNNDS